MLIVTKRIPVILAFGAVLALTTSSDAGHRNRRSARGGSHGSQSGGSSGGLGSGGSSGGFVSGGSSGGFGSAGSSGGRAAGGSSGGMGSSGGFVMGGSSGGFVSGGSSGGLGSGGSSGTSVSGRAGNGTTAGAKAKAQLVMHVPEDAKVFLVNQEMTLTGTTRKFSTPELEAGLTYSIAIRVEVVRDGEALEATAKQPVAAGQSLQLKVDLDDTGKLQISPVAEISSTRSTRAPSLIGD